jgi:hypothetical protein
VDNNVVALVPVDRGGNLVFVTQLEGIDHSDDLVKRTAGLGRVGYGEADDLLGIDHEDGSERRYEIQIKSTLEDFVHLTVKGIPFESTLVGSTASNMS